MNSGRDGRLEIVHCDRIRKKSSQELSQESPSSGTTVYEEVPPLTEVSDKDQGDELACDTESVFREGHKRRTHLPSRFKDFVL